MDAFELNKIAGAVLAALLVIFAARPCWTSAMHEHKPEKPGWALPITEAAPVAAKEPAAPFDAKAGAGACCPRPAPTTARTAFKKCLACHTPDKGGPQLVRAPISGASSGAQERSGARLHLIRMP